MEITALLGYPTAHSVSPKLFSIYANDLRLEYSHLKIDVTPGNLKHALSSVRKLGFVGLNITLPYKMEVIKYLDSLDKQSKEIGAVNTIVIRKGRMRGYNTDSYGAVRAIRDHTTITSKKALVIGTGGAARAIISGLMSENAQVVVIFRQPKSQRTKGMMKSFRNKVRFVDIKDTQLLIQTISQSDIVCNATSCGMSPNSKYSPISHDLLKKASRGTDFSKKLFFDAIFNPYETAFLRNAKKLGADIQGGTEMMIYQGIKAFELWTSKAVNKKSIQKAKVVLKRDLLNEK
jgi:shikimate dehydrogenase